MQTLKTVILFFCLHYLLPVSSLVSTTKSALKPFALYRQEPIDPDSRELSVNARLLSCSFVSSYGFEDNTLKMVLQNVL